MRRRSDRTDEAIAVGFDGAVEAQKWKDRADMVKMVKLTRCSTIANRATTAVPATRSFVRVSTVRLFGQRRRVSSEQERN